jgi:hypothetical protein
LTIALWAEMEVTVAFLGGPAFVPAGAALLREGAAALAGAGFFALPTAGRDAFADALCLADFSGRDLFFDGVFADFFLLFLLLLLACFVAERFLPAMT